VTAVLYMVGLLNTAVYRSAVLIFNKLSLWHQPTNGTIYFILYIVFYKPRTRYAFSMISVASIHLAVHRNGDTVCFTIIIFSST